MSVFVGTRERGTLFPLHLFPLYSRYYCYARYYGPEEKAEKAGTAGKKA